MRIYIGNLSHKTTDEELYDLFSEHGQVIKAYVIIDYATGQSRGFGFVEMANEADGEQAIDILNEIEFEGKTLTVNRAKYSSSNLQNDNIVSTVIDDTKIISSNGNRYRSEHRSFATTSTGY